LRNRGGCKKKMEGKKYFDISHCRTISDSENEAGSAVC
jgi:hypothetical protein